MKNNFLNAIRWLLIIFTAVYACINSSATASACRKALELCAFSVIPSLFIFTVISTFLALLLSRHAFGGKAMLLTLFGFFSGSAASMCGICTLYRNGKISKRSCEQMLALLPGCSIPFYLSYCSGYTQSPYNSAIIGAASILSCICAYLILCTGRNFGEKQGKAINVQKDSFSSMLTLAVTKSGISIINMCSFIIFFTVAFSLLSSLLLKAGFVHPLITPFISGFFEVTGAVAQSTVFDGNARLMYIAFVCGFSGLSIIMQGCSVCNEYGISAKYFIYSRLLNMLLTPLYTLLLLFILPRSVPAFSFSSLAVKQENINRLIFVFTGIIILLTVWIFICIDKKYKNTR